MRVQDPRGLGPAVRRNSGRPAQGSRPADPRQDQHGRVRDGLLHRALRLRADPQPVGHRPDPRRFRWRLRRSSGVLPGSAGDRHRHRRLHPPAGRPDRHGRGEADLRRDLALRPRRDGELPRPGRPRHPHRPRREPAARDRRRARPARLHEHRPAGATGRAVSPRRRRRQPRRPQDRRGHRARWRGLPAGSPAALRPGGRAAGRRRGRGRAGHLPELRARAGGVLPDHAERGLLQPRPLRRDALRPAGAARGSRVAQRRRGHAGHPRRGLRRRGEAPDHHRHLRAVQRLLRRLLRAGAEGAHADQPRPRARLREGRRAALADRADHGVQAGGEARRPAGDVPQRHRHHPRQPGRAAGHLGARRGDRGGRPPGRAAGARSGPRRRPALPGRCGRRGAAGAAVGRPDDRSRQARQAAEQGGAL